MAEAPAYLIVGRGGWAGRMHTLLASEHRQATQIAEARQSSGESAGAYRSRLAERMRSSGARIAWLCVLPGPHVITMIEASLDAGLHVIAEKPWYGSHEITNTLIARAKPLRRLIAAHYEYCFLNEVQRWRKDFGSESGLRFGGRFFLSRPNHTGMSALDNLATHLLAIRAYAVPQAALGQISCGYEQPDERQVWLERDGARVATLDLLHHAEPIIQRFLASFEASLDAAEFPIDLNLAMRVADAVAGLR